MGKERVLKGTIDSYKEADLDKEKVAIAFTMVTNFGNIKGIKKVFAQEDCSLAFASEDCSQTFALAYYQAFTL